MNFAIRFTDVTVDPLAARSGSTPAKGLPDAWLDALLGVGSVGHRTNAAPGMLSRISLSFPTRAHAEQFTLALRHVSKLLGTRAEIETLTPQLPFYPLG
jgi:hypothetical protein